MMFPYPIPMLQVNLKVPFLLGVKSIVSLGVLAYFETPKSLIVKALRQPWTELSLRDIYKTHFYFFW